MNAQILELLNQTPEKSKSQNFKDLECPKNYMLENFQEIRGERGPFLVCEAIDANNMRISVKCPSSFYDKLKQIDLPIPKLEKSRLLLSYFGTRTSQKRAREYYDYHITLIE